MGVPGFFAWLLKNKNEYKTKMLITNKMVKKVKYLMMDINCLLHPCVSYIIDLYEKGLIDELNKDVLNRELLELFIWEKIQLSIDQMICIINPEILYLAVDGVAPMGKITQQRQRRYKYLYDASTTSFDKLFEKKPVSSIELTPGTKFMERLNNKFNEYVAHLNKSRLKCIYSSFMEEGEGEHKILQYIKNNVEKDKTIIIYGLDADLLFLSLIPGKSYDIYVMREEVFFKKFGESVKEEVYNDKNKYSLKREREKIQSYNYVEIRELHELINNLHIETNDFIIICFLIGNDFIPSILTLDIKSGGLDKIIDAYSKIKHKFKHDALKSIYNTSENKIVINHKFLKSLFTELLWTENNVWNKDKNFISDKKFIAEYNKLCLGEMFNIEFLNVPFTSSTEYISYYKGTDNIYNDNSSIVQHYINGIVWCTHYYFNKCISWKWSYPYMIAPLIKDIINYYPKKIILSIDKCKLIPVEQLILVIPKLLHKYVIDKDILEKFNKLHNIGYMFPTYYNIDVRKEKMYWKTLVNIPNVDYDEYITEIKLLNI